MMQLLVIRNYIKNFVGRNENLVKPISKFLLALVTIIMINNKVGYAGALKSTPLAVIVSLMASFLPMNATIAIAVLYILLHLYSLSLACVLVVGLFLLMMFLLYFRFSPNDTILLLLTPISFALKIPYVMPLSAGLVSGPASVVAIGCGTVMYYMLSFISASGSELTITDTSEILLKLQFVLDNLLFNKEMLVLIVAFAFSLIVVTIIRRLSVDHSWTIAIVAGTLMNIMVVLIGDLKYGTYISIPNLFFASIVAIAVVFIIKLFLFNVDYSRTEKVQYEDDEYYYYVKAVPKIVGPDLAPKEKASAKDDKKPKKTEASRRQASERVSRDERTRKDSMTDIERAVAAKARANRQQKGNGESRR